MGATLIGSRITLRDAEDGDAPFLQQLHHIGRAAEIAPLGWPPALARHFLDDQFRLREAHYRVSYPDADRLIVSKREMPIGRLLLDRRARVWRLVDIALSPEAQGRGLGGALIGWIKRWARRDGAESIDLHVLQGNARAETFYRRHGFADTDSDSTPHRRLIWRIH